MLDWSPVLHIADTDSPLYARIALAVVADIQTGRLAPGQRLPGSRTLAAQLGVHRNTILAAWADLEAQGWISSAHGSGTWISRKLPERAPAPRQDAPPPQRPAQHASPTFPLPDPIAPTLNLVPAGVINMAGGLPDPRLIPHLELARAYRRHLGRRTGAALSYGDPQGHPTLRRELAKMLAARRGLTIGEEHVLVTRGSQMGLYLVGALLLTGGRNVAVEELGYPPAWAALRQAGASLLPVAVDHDGLDVDALERLLGDGGPSAVYLTPHHQYPTLATLAAPRRTRLIDLARQHRLAILEDDYDNELHYEGRPVLPLASLDTLDVVIYVGTLSKVLAPGLRIGYVVAHPEVIQRLTRLRTVIDRQGDLAMEAAVAELLEDGTLQRHVHRLRRTCHARRDALLDALHTHLPGALEADRPRGGMALWARVADDLDVDAWAQRALDAGVAVSPGRRYTFDHTPLQRLRLGFAAADERELEAAVQRLARTVRPGARAG